MKVFFGCIPEKKIMLQDFFRFLQFLEELMKESEETPGGIPGTILEEMLRSIYS